MQDIRIDFTSGPMAGESFHYDLGALLVGREPHPEPGQQVLLLRGADSAVSRDHALITERDGEIVLRNVGTNGTQVNGKLVQDEQVLKPGTRIAIGTNHALTIDWQLVGPKAQTQKKEKKPATQVASSGPLASPLVRTVLAVYLLGIIVIAAWLSWSGGGDGEIADDWPQLSAEYADYNPEGLAAQEKERRTRLAEAILVRLRVLRANERNADVQRLCRELMRIDSDIQSPLYRYGAKCLGNAE